MKAIGSVILSLLCMSAYASSDSSSRSINYSGYLETYYSYDFGNPSYDKERYTMYKKMLLRVIFYISRISLLILYLINCGNNPDFSGYRSL